MSSKRKSSSNAFPKKARTISFVGAEGYEVMDFFDEEGGRFVYGKSGLAIELIKLYREAINTYGREDALFKMRLSIEKDKSKIKIKSRS